jgi:hypothetical protein
MGRFFRTTTPQNVDFMYQLPENLMFKATQQASQDITENQTAMFNLYDKLKLEALSADKPRAKEILAGYEDKVNELSQQLQENPLNFRRKGGEITNLARTVHKDFTTGEAAAIGANYNAYVEMIKETQEAVKSKRVTDVTSINPFVSQQLKKFGKTQFNQMTGDYNRFSPDQMVSTFDIETELAKNAKEMEAQIRASSKAITKDGYIIERDGKTEIKTKDDIMRDAMNSIALNPQAMQYLRQRNEIGAMSGWINEKGGLNVEKDSPFYNLSSTIAERFDKNNVLEYRERMKNDTETGGAGSTTKNNTVVDRNNAVINRPTIAGVNTAIIDKAKPETHPITQQNNQILALEESASLALVDAAGQTARFIAKNGGLTEEKSAIIKKLAEDGDANKLKLFAIANGVTPEIIDNAVNQIETTKRQIATITANRNMFMNQALKNLGLTQDDKLTDFEKKSVLESANNAMMNSKVNASKTVSVFQTNGDIFEDDKQKKVFDNVVEKIKTDAGEGILPPSLVVSKIEGGKLTITKTTNEAFQQYLKDTRTVTKASTGTDSYTAAEKKEKSGTYKEKKDLNVSKVLEDITTDSGETISKPFSIDYGNNVTVYVDANTYTNEKLDEALNMNSSKIEILKSMKDLNILGTAGMKSIKENFPDQKFESFTAPLLSDHMDYTPPETEGGTGYITFKFDTPISFGGKMQKRITLPADSKQAMELAKRTLNTK